MMLLLTILKGHVMHEFSILQPKLDLQKIVDGEINYTTNIVIIVTPTKSLHGILVLIKESFLKLFSEESNYVVGGERLSPDWGIPLCEISADQNEFGTDSYLYQNDLPIPGGWRCLPSSYWISREESQDEVILNLKKEIKEATSLKAFNIISFD